MQPLYFRRLLLLAAAVCSLLFSFAQQNLPEDYLSPAFHKGRREAARARMPEGSVLVVFAAPARTFSNDVEYLYHQNPDLYYFTGYKEPDAVLFLFKEEQTGPDGSTYNELFFVRQRNAQMEQWTGRRLGVEGVREKLGIRNVFNGEALRSFPLDLTRFKTIICDDLPQDVADNTTNPADLYDLLAVFRQKANLPVNYNAALQKEFSVFIQYASAQNIPQTKKYFETLVNANRAYGEHPVLQQILRVEDSAGIQKIKESLGQQLLRTDLFFEITASLREIKTPEEMALIRKAVEISCRGQNEVMKAVHPGMSELEIQGLHEFVHKKYGAEGVGYGSIIGSGENGCILHYMENTKTKIGTEMLLMDVGAEYHGYTADVTRTIPVDGKFSAEEKAIYNLVYDAQEAAFRRLKDGAKWADVSAAAKETIANGLVKLGILKNKDDVGTYYPHGLGHHIGLDVHDRGSYETLKKGMVITIEPGIYIPPNSNCDKKWWNIAVRIEDDALIRENDYELLSSFAPRSVEAIEKLIAEKSVLDNFQLPALQSAKKAF